MYTLNVTNQPAEEVISTATAQAFLRVNTSTENTIIGNLCIAARQRFEREAQIGLITQTVVQSIQFPPPYDIPFMTGPVQSISSVTYYDQNNTIQTATGYNVDIITGGMGRVWFPNGQPNMSSQVRPVMQITAVIGFGSSPSSVPMEIQQALLNLIDFWFFNRSAYGDNMAAVPATFDDAVAKYRLGVFGQWGLDRRRRHSMYGNCGFPWSVGGFDGWWGW
jgi:uncharacterized phiE125 gp8 family phage protein